jgi:hypothetical protein
MLGNYRVSTQVVGCRVVLCSVEFVSVVSQSVSQSVTELQFPYTSHRLMISSLLALLTVFTLWQLGG